MPTPAVRTRVIKIGPLGQLLRYRQQRSADQASRHTTGKDARETVHKQPGSAARCPFSDGGESDCVDARRTAQMPGRFWRHTGCRSRTHRGRRSARASDHLGVRQAPHRRRPVSSAADGLRSGYECCRAKSVTGPIEATRIGCAATESDGYWSSIDAPGAVTITAVFSGYDGSVRSVDG